MPPLALDRFKTRTRHHIAKQASHTSLLCCYIGRRKMRPLTKEIERRAHIHLLARSHIEQRKIKRAAPRMSRVASQETLHIDKILRDVGVKDPFHQSIISNTRPKAETESRPCRTISIENLQPIAHLFQRRRSLRQRISRLASADSHRSIIAIDAATHEIVGAEITQIQDHIGHKISETDKTSGIASDGIGYNHRIDTIGHNRRRKR